MFDDESILIVELMVIEKLVKWILVTRMELSVGKIEELVPFSTSLEPIELVLEGTSQRETGNLKKPFYPILASSMHLPCLESYADPCCLALENNPERHSRPPQPCSTSLHCIAIRCF